MMHVVMYVGVNKEVKFIGLLAVSYIQHEEGVSDRVEVLPGIYLNIHIYTRTYIHTLHTSKRFCTRTAIDNQPFQYQVLST